MTGIEMVEFGDAVYKIYDFDELEKLLRRLNQDLGKLVANKGFDKQVAEIVGIANSQGWLPQFVSLVLKDRGNTQAIKDFLTANPDWDLTRSPSAADPCETLRVIGGRSFVGRKKLRGFLKEMNKLTGKKVLLVNSDHSKVGKTYSKDLVDFLADSRECPVVYLDLDTASYDPIRLTRELGARMAVDLSAIPDQGSEQASRSNHDLVSLLIPPTPRPGCKECWIILDGFKKIPSEATRELIAQLTQAVQGRKDFRLLLINYQWLPINLAGFAFRDKVQPLTRSEWEDFLKCVHRNKYGNPPSVEALTEYLDGVDHWHKEFIEEAKKEMKPGNDAEVQSQSEPDLEQDHVFLNLAITMVADSISADPI